MGERGELGLDTVTQSRVSLELQLVSSLLQRHYPGLTPVQVLQQVPELLILAQQLVSGLCQVDGLSFSDGLCGGIKPLLQFMDSLVELSILKIKTI